MNGKKRIRTPKKQEWFPTLLAYLTHLGHKKKTLALAERFVQETSSQDAYVAALKASYAFRRTEDFRRYLAELRKSGPGANGLPL